MISRELAQHQVTAHADHRHQIVEVVGDAPGQTGDAFHLHGLAELFLELLALRDVDDHGEGARHQALGVDDGGRG